MSQIIPAIFDSGVFKPLVPVELAEGTRVEVGVPSHATDSDDARDWIDHDAHRMAEAEGDTSMSIEEVQQRLSSIKGSLADVVIAERGEY